MVENVHAFNKRRLKRSHLIYYLRVFDRNTDQMLGHLVDITPEGIMLVSELPIPVGEKFQIRMMLPKLLFDKSRMDFEVESVWSNNDVNPDFYDTGFRLLSISDGDKSIIEQLIHEYGFND